MVNEKGCANSINLQVLFENDSDKVIGSSLEKVKAFANYLLENKDFEANITGSSQVKVQRKVIKTVTKIVLNII